MSELNKSRPLTTRPSPASKQVRSARTLALAAATAAASLAGPAMAEKLRFIDAFDLPALPGLTVSAGNAAPSFGLSNSVVGQQGVFSEAGATSGSSIGGGLEVDLTWNAPNTGTFSTAANWTPSQVPLAADNLTFPTGASNYTATNDTALVYGIVQTTNTGAGIPTIAGGLNAGKFVVTAGSAVISGGTLNLTNTASPGVGVAAPNANATTALTVASTSTSVGTLDINGGATVVYTQGYASQSLGANGTINVSGAGTIVRPDATTGGANGRFGVMTGTGTINVTDGAEVQARLFEFGRQDGASLASPNVVTVNVTNGGRLGQFNTATQAVLARGANTNATLNVTGGGQINFPTSTAGLFLSFDAAGVSSVANVSGAGSQINANVSVDGGATLNVSNGGSVTTQSRLDLDANGTINVNAGGTLTAQAAFLAGQPEATRVRTFNVNGGNVRMTSRTITQLQFVDANSNPLPASSGTLNINVTNGGSYSTGYLNGGNNAPGVGTTQTTNLVVDGTNSVFEAKNSGTFGNSYLSIGGSDLAIVAGATTPTGNAITNVTVRNNAIVRAIDDDAAGGAFISIGDGNGQVVNMNIESGGFVGTNQAVGRGGSVSIGTGNGEAQTTVNIGSTTAAQSVLQAVGSPDGTGAGGAQLQIGSGVYTFFDPNPSVVNVNVNSGGKLFAGPDVSTFVAIDYNTIVNLNVTGTGVMDLGGFVALGGGNSGTTSSTSNSGGNTNLTVSGGGTFVADTLLLARDYANNGNFSNEKIVTNITVTGAGSTFTLDGVDNTTTTGIDDGYFSVGGGTVTTSDYSEITIKAQNGGVIKAGEASFLGDTKNGFTLVEVSGAGSVFDSSRQLTVNADGLENSLATFNISGGGVLKTTSSAAQASGSMFFGTAVSTATGTSTVVNVTGAGSKLESSSGIFLGASIDGTTSAIVDGTPATLTAGAGTTVSAAGTFLIGGTSSATTSGTVNVGGVAMVGNWTVNGGSVTSTSLQLLGTSTLDVTPTNALAPVLIKTGNLSVGTTAKIELHKNAMQLTPGGTTPTTIADVKTLITNGATGGITSADLTATTGIGIALVTAPGTFLGSPTAAGDILVRYTLSGDADLSGNVNFDDLLKLAANYNQTGQYWYQGDFNNDGTVNFDDLLKLAANYNQTLTGTLGGDWALAQSAVPEPTSLLAIGLGGAAILGRRRRR